MKKILLPLTIIILLICIAFITKNIFLNKSIITDNKEFLTIKGIDVSHLQKQIEWPKVKETGIRFAFIKSTQGCYFKDTIFDFNISEARKQGIKVGAYHFFDFEYDPICQFINFKKNTDPELLDLPPVIDLEYLQNEELKKSENKAKFLQNLRVMEKLVGEYFKVKPLFYTTPDFYHNLIKDNFDNEIWICHIENKKIDFLNEKDWNFRQYSFRGKVAGIKVDVDLDFFKGNEDEFKSKLLQ